MPHCFVSERSLIHLLCFREHVRLSAAKAHLQVCQPVGGEMAHGGMWWCAVAHLGAPTCDLL